ISDPVAAPSQEESSGSTLAANLRARRAAEREAKARLQRARTIPGAEPAPQPAAATAPPPPPHDHQANDAMQRVMGDIKDTAHGMNQLLDKIARSSANLRANPQADPKKIAFIDQHQRTLKGLNQHANALLRSLNSMESAAFPANDQNLKMLEQMKQESLKMLNRLQGFLAYLDNSTPQNQDRRANQRQAAPTAPVSASPTTSPEPTQPPPPAQSAAQPQPREEAIQATPRRQWDRNQYQTEIEFISEDGRRIQGNSQDISLSSLQMTTRESLAGIQRGTTGSISLLTDPQKRRFPCRIQRVSDQTLVISVTQQVSKFGIVVAELMMGNIVQSGQ
ncbi:MAG: hypothetical protein HQL53_08975, partial [Magnetococcales bacterium]|nr:hypothetical protein [Magnetococcales bacterium]